MNPIAKQFITSLIFAVVTFGLIHLVHEKSADLGKSAELISFVIIFAGIFIATFFATGKSSARPAAKKSNDNNPSKPSASNADQESGVVKWFNVKKGYGFITRESGEDIFVHYKNILGNGKRVISEGQEVRFIVTTGDKGLQADEVEAA